MPQNLSGNTGGNSNDPQKVSVVGKVPIEYDPKALNDIANAIRNQNYTFSAFSRKYLKTNKLENCHTIHSMLVWIRNNFRLNL